MWICRIGNARGTPASDPPKTTESPKGFHLMVKRQNKGNKRIEKVHRENRRQKRMDRKVKAPKSTMDEQIIITWNYKEFQCKRKT